MAAVRAIASRRVVLAWRPKRLSGTALRSRRQEPWHGHSRGIADADGLRLGRKPSAAIAGVLTN
jgi:hypothetical protein